MVKWAPGAPRPFLRRSCWTDALPGAPAGGLGTARDPSPSVSTETGIGSAGLTSRDRDDAEPPASAGPLRGREGTEEREATYAMRVQVSLRAEDPGNVARGRWRLRRSSPVASAAAGDAAGATAELVVVVVVLLLLLLAGLLAGVRCLG